MVSLTQSGQIIDIKMIWLLAGCWLQFIGFRNKVHHDWGAGAESVSGRREKGLFDDLSRNNHQARDTVRVEKRNGFFFLLAKGDLISL